jgi:hypothetical protein
MKTIFTHEEICQFFQKKKDAIVGDEILSRIPPDFNDFPHGLELLEMFNFIYKQGLKQGEIEGRVNLMNELIVFFEL